MLSVVLYGRNDSHGYNLHKRAALGINCLAHLLGDDDEIVFVDYNTPASMPTFPEAIADTFTPRARQLLRVLRVPERVHRERFAARTHLPAVEPVARNAGVRRTNPSNRWVLATNADMIFVPRHRDVTLGEIVADLEDGYYALPRFDLPEGLWEMLDRSDPAGAIATVGSWGTRLHLDEIVTSYEWIGFDAPGDFQLVPRDRLVAMHGFNEDMVLGWHVDSNLSRRLGLAYGDPGDLRRELRGYHCDHTRIPGIHHGADRVANDLAHFVYSVEEVDLPDQADSWGLADLELEEIRLSAPHMSALADGLLSVLPDSDVEEPQPIDARTCYATLHYRAEHVLPFVASALDVLPPTAVIAYVGINTELVQLLAPLLVELGITAPLVVIDEGLDGPAPPPPGSQGAWESVVADADAVVFDFGLPLARARTPHASTVHDWPVEIRRGLGRVLTRLNALSDVDTGSSARARPDRSYIAVGAVYNFLEPFVARRVASAGWQFNTRVRHGTALRGAEGTAPSEHDSAVLSWAVGYGHDPEATIRYRIGSELDFSRPEIEPHLAGTWSWGEHDGRWTDGPRAAVLLDLDDVAVSSDLVLAVWLSDFYVPRDREALAVDLVLNGQIVDRWVLARGEPAAQQRHRIVEGALVRKCSPTTVELRIEDPRSPLQDGSGEDRRALGVRIASIELVEETPVRAGDIVKTVQPYPPSSMLWRGWSWTEAEGTWSDGPEACLRLPPLDLPTSTAEVVLDLASVHAHPEHPFRVDVTVGDGPATHWELTQTGPQRHRLTLPATRERSTMVRLTLPDASSPASRGQSSDTRELGIMLRSLSIERPKRAHRVLRTPRWRASG